MNRDFLEMLHCINIPVISAEVKGMEISVLERQRFSLKWQHDQLQSMLLAQEEYFHGSSLTLNELLTQPIKTDSWIDFGMPNNGLADESSGIQYVGEVDNHAISRTASCLPLPVKGTESKGRQVIVLDQKLSGANGSQSFKKRKAEKIMPPKGGAEGDKNLKRTKACLEEEGSTTTSQKSNKKSNISQSSQKKNDVDKNDKRNRETSGCTSSEVQKTDYIHVRARRGQATDSHSLAERVRREKISERMKHLQDLVPGCNKITGKAGMLDEIINYVQSLQRQVEFLSMKLAAVNHTFDFSVDDLIAKQVLAICSTSMSTIGETPDMTNTNYLQYNPIQQSQPFYEYEVAENSIDPFRFNQSPSSLPWDADLQNICSTEFHQERYTSSQAFTGNFEASSLKMEM